MADVDEKEKAEKLAAAKKRVSPNARLALLVITLRSLNN